MVPALWQVFHRLPADLRARLADDPCTTLSVDDAAAIREAGGTGDVVTLDDEPTPRYVLTETPRRFVCWLASVRAQQRAIDVTRPWVEDAIGGRDPGPMPSAIFDEWAALYAKADHYRACAEG